MLAGLRGERIAEHFFNRDVWVNFELAAVIVLASGKFVFGDVLEQDVWFAVAGGAACLAYIFARTHARAGLIEVWGFSSKNLHSSMSVTLPVTAACVAATVWYGTAAGTAVFHWHMAAVLLLYPLWGIVQQFLLVVLVAGNVDRLTGGRLPRLFIVLPTAVLFALVHIPVPELMGATFLMGCFTTAMFLRYRSLWALGLFHGIFATALYYFVLGEDPLRGFMPFL